jgi:hypothetical protein
MCKVTFTYQPILRTSSNSQIWPHLASHPILTFKLPVPTTDWNWYQHCPNNDNNLKMKVNRSLRLTRMWRLVVPYIGFGGSWCLHFQNRRVQLETEAARLLWNVGTEKRCVLLHFTKTVSDHVFRHNECNAKYSTEIPVTTLLCI